MKKKKMKMKRKRTTTTLYAKDMKKEQTMVINFQFEKDFFRLDRALFVFQAIFLFSSSLSGQMFEAPWVASLF